MQAQPSYNARNSYNGGSPQKQVKATEHNMGEVGGHTSVKVHNPPGGRSNINLFGSSDEHMIAPANHGRGMAQNMGSGRTHQYSQQNLGSSYQIGANTYKVDGVIHSYANPAAFEQRDMNRGYGKPPQPTRNSQSYQS